MNVISEYKMSLKIIHYLRRSFYQKQNYSNVPKWSLYISHYFGDISWCVKISDTIFLNPLTIGQIQLFILWLWLGNPAWNFLKKKLFFL